MKYRIVGADGKVYGPVELQELRQWLVQGRVESRTPVHLEGAPQWTTLGALPELAAEAAPPPPVATIAAAQPSRGTNGMATAGLICSLLGWACCCCLPFDLLGVILCLIALAQINSQAQPQEGRVFAILGLVLSTANIVFVIGGVLLQLLLKPGSINWQAGQF